MLRPPSWARWLTLAAALLLLNAALTFHNVWPTLAIRLATPPELSLELALVLLALVAWGAWRAAARPVARGTVHAPGARDHAGVRPRRAVTALTIASLAFLVARYAEVTAPALYGRPVNLYWDVRHVGNVVRMLTEVAGIGRALLVTAGVVLATVLAYLAFRAAWSRVVVAMERTPERHVVGASAGFVATTWLAALAGAPLAPEHVRHSLPVAVTYAQQARLIAGAFAATRTSAASSREATHEPADGLPAAHTRGFGALAGDDVVLVFLESYGSVTYTRPEFSARLEAPRRALAAAVADTQRRALSATLTAPTFGGNSWLSHLTLLTGMRIADPEAYARTMQVPRPTLVQEFAAAGYETLALMPGLRQAWPEGAFYGFDEIIGADALHYRGPAFGWWRIPDQYALAKLDGRPRGDRPRFVFFPTISSHAPFRPTPPYQPAWERLASDHPFDEDARSALVTEPEWTNLGPAYGDTIAYAHEWLAGWLRRHADAGVTLVVLGDHQPPSAVSGPGADWTVPVHVVTRRENVVNTLIGAGFVDGLRAPRAPLMQMHALRPVLRAAFTGDRDGGALPRSADAASRSRAAVEHSVARPIAPTRVYVSGGARTPGVGELRP